MNSLELLRPLRNLRYRAEVDRLRLKRFRHYLKEQNSGEKLRLSAETVSKNVTVIDDGTEIVISIKITHQERRSEVMHALHQVFEQLTALESPSLGRK